MCQQPKPRQVSQALANLRERTFRQRQPLRLGVEHDEGLLADGQATGSEGLDSAT